jgi:pimeloyl-ACP methyl ester carboxylesterase
MSTRRIVVFVTAIVVLILGGLTLRTLFGVRHAELAFPPIGQFAEIDGATLHYVDRGSGPAVVLLHGNPGFVEDFTLGPANLVDALAKQYRVVAIDRPGHGYSARPSDRGTTPHEQARLVHDLLSRLGVQRAVFVGHSWGGGLTLIYAEEHPENVAGLVLLGTRAFPSPERADPVYALNRVPIVGALFRATLLPPVGQRLLSRRLTAAYAPDPVREDHVAAARALWMRPGQVAATVWDTKNLQLALDGASKRFGSITAPMVVLVGDHDRGIEDSRRLAAAVPGAELRVLPNTGHEIPLTRPSEVEDAIRHILNRKPVTFPLAPHENGILPSHNARRH